MVHQQAGDPTFHGAFISYSRKDRPFAVLLQPERVVVLYSGQAVIYPALPCGSEDALLQRAAATRPSAD